MRPLKRLLERPHSGPFIPAVQARMLLKVGHKLQRVRSRLVEAALPEREPHPAVFADFLTLLDALGEDGWAVAYIRWEAALLADLGFGLDLSACAVSGEIENLAWVSPRTGRAVSADAGKPYERRLLPLPGFLWRGFKSPYGARGDFKYFF